MPLELISNTNPSVTAAECPFVYNDPAASADTAYLYQFNDAVCWASQASPTVTTAALDLGPIGTGGGTSANATVSSTVTFSNGALVFNSTVTTDLLTLPTSAVWATDVTKAGIAFSFKPTSTANAGTQYGIAGCVTSGTGFDHAQWSVHRDGAYIYIKIDGTAVYTMPIVANTVYHVALTTELSGSTYTNKAWVNGVLAATTTSSSPMVQPGSPYNIVYFGKCNNLFANSDDFNLYRVHGWNGAATYARSAAQWVADDYAVHVESAFA